MDVLAEILDVGRQRFCGDSKQRGQGPGLLIVVLALLRRQGSEDRFVCQQGAIDERGVDPAERVDLVGFVTVAALECGGVFEELAGDSRVQGVEMPGRGEGLVGGSKDHGEDDAKCVVEPGYRAVEKRRVLAERGRDPGMGELEQRRAARAKKERRLAGDTPAYGFWTEDAGVRVGECGRNLGEKLFDTVPGDGVVVVNGLRRASELRRLHEIIKAFLVGELLI